MELLPNAIMFSFTVDFVLKVCMLDTYYLETSLYAVLYGNYSTRLTSILNYYITDMMSI